MVLAWVVKILFTIVFVVVAVGAFRPPRKISFCLLAVGAMACVCTAIWLSEMKTAIDKVISLGVIGILVASYIARTVEQRKERLRARIPM